MVNFNRIAPFYDALSKIVFKDSLLWARSCFINELPEFGTVLYIGGGSGIALDTIRNLKPDLHVDFIEASEKFISIAKKRNSSDRFKHVNFIHGNENQIPLEKKYKAVITFFVVDIFPQNEAEEFCKNVVSHLEPGGVWLFADFIPSDNLYQKLLLKFMYICFRIVANIPANQLPDYDLIFKELNMREEGSKFFYNEMVCSKVLRKI